jgi:hypothetical protein
MRINRLMRRDNGRGNARIIVKAQSAGIFMKNRRTKNERH